MKKSVCALGGLLCLSLAVLLCSHFAVGAAEGKVELEEFVLAGDRSAAQGLSLTYLTNDNSSHLFWDTRVALDGELAAETDFQFYTDSYTRDYSWEPIAYLPSASASFGMSGIVSESEDIERDCMLLPALDAAARTDAGEERTEVLRLRDYYDYFPISLEIYAQSGHISSSDWRGQDPLFSAEDYARLNAYFRVPVPEDMLVTVTAERNDKGELVRVESDPAETYDEERGWYDPLPNWGLVSADEDMAYLLALPAATGADTVAAGIHVIPILNSEEDIWRLRPDLDHIQLLRPLDLAPEAVLRFAWNEDKSQLMLYTREGGKLVLTTIDPATGETDQRLELLDMDGEDDWAGFISCGPLHLSYTSSETFVLVAEAEGLFTSVLTGSTDLPDSLPYLFSRDAQLAWDGKRMALAAHIPGRAHEGLSPEERRLKVGFGLAVWDADGLQYGGFYEYVPGRDWSNWYGGNYRDLFHGQVDALRFD